MRLVNPVVSRRSLTFLLLVASLAGATPAFAQGDLVVRKPVDRRFPQGQFCPLPIDLEFTSPGSSVRVVFEAKVFVLDPNDNQLHWTEQFIDNVMMTTAATSDANTAPPPSGSDHELCYIGDPQPTPFLYFNNPGMTFQLHDRFDTDPAARGWDFLHGAYYSTRSAWRNPEAVFPTPADVSGGSIGLGQDSSTPNEADIASTEITVSGLTQGENYNLSAWWDVGHVIFGSTETFLTVSIYGPSGTPVVRRSWGGLKRTYR